MMTNDSVPFLINQNEYLLTCPLCGEGYLYLYNKGYKDKNDCVCCENCRYFNTLENWNTGAAEKAWDNRTVKRIRFLERISGLTSIAQHVEDRRIK
jgi:hypothetical protein